MYTITLSRFQKTKTIFDIINTKDKIKLYDNVIEHVLPHLSNYKGRIYFDKLKSYISLKLFLINDSIDLTNALKHCKDWVERIIVHNYDSFFSLRQFTFTKLKYLWIMTKYDNYGSNDVVREILNNHCNTLQKIEHSNNESILPLLNTKFPKLQVILSRTTAIRPIDPFNIPHITLFPMLKYVDVKLYPNRLEGTLPIKGIGGFLLDHILCNRYKFKAIVTFILCLRWWKFSKDLQELLKAYVLSIPNLHWNKCPTNQEYNCINNAKVVTRDMTFEFLEYSNTYSHQINAKLMLENMEKTIAKAKEYEKNLPEAQEGVTKRQKILDETITKFL